MVEEWHAKSFMEKISPVMGGGFNLRWDNFVEYLESSVGRRGGVGGRIYDFV